MLRASPGFEAWGALDGFGRTAAALFTIDGDEGLDGASVPRTRAACSAAGSPVGLVDAETGARVACRAAYSEAARVVAVLPDDVLEPGRAYLAFVTTALVTPSGVALAPDEEFRAIRDGDPAARDSAAGQSFGAAVTRLADAGLVVETLASATMFTTQTEHRRLRALRAALFDQFPEPPALLTTSARFPVFRFGAASHPGWTSTLAEWAGTPRIAADGSHVGCFPGADPEPSGGAHDQLGVVLNAAFVSPRWTRDYTESGDRDDGTIEWSSAGAPVVVDPAEEVPITLVLPRSPPPAEGYPVAIFQHGLGNQRIFALAIANELARAGIATLAIDAPWNGLRLPDARDVASPDVPGASYAGPDGFADDFVGALSILYMIGHWKQPLTARDNFWQATLDLVQLRRLIGSPTLDLSIVADEYGGVPPSLDASRVGFIGMSMGGFLGTGLAGIEPRASIGPFVIDVAASGFFTILPEAPITTMQFPLVATLAGLPLDALDSLARPYPHVMAGIFDGADPGSLAADAVTGPDDAGHDLWFLSALHDEAAHRAQNDVFARALGAAQVTPTVRPVEGLPQVASPLSRDDTSGRTVGYYEVAPGHHGHLLYRYQPQMWAPAEDDTFVSIDSFPIRESCESAQRAVVHFLETAWGGAAEIDVTGGPEAVDDFDDDSFCASEETAAGTDPLSATSHPAGAGACGRAMRY